MLNKIQFIGHLGRDPETRSMPNGTQTCAFSVASTEKWKDKASGEQMEATEWLRCAAFDRLAEVCGEYLRKGSLVYVEGSLKTRKYTDKDGVERTVTECRLANMKMLGGRPENSEHQSAPAQRQQSAPQRQSTQQRAPARQAAPTGGGFDDFDSDVPF